MAKIANVALTNTFDTWRIRSNQAFDRLSQFAINNSSLYANTITANVALTASGTATFTGLMTASGRATVGTNLTVSGNTTLGAAGKTITTTGAWTHTGTATISTNLIVSGNLTISGTTTTVDSTTLTVADKNIELAKGSSTDAAADGGGITLHGTTDHTWNRSEEHTSDSSHRT